MRSGIMKKGAERTPHRSLFRAAGDFSKPFIGVCNSCPSLAASAGTGGVLKAE